MLDDVADGVILIVAELDAVTKLVEVVVLDVTSILAITWLIFPPPAAA